MYKRHTQSSLILDEEIQKIVDMEYNKLNSYANLIGSANYPFPSVIKVLDTPFNLNPSEGSVGNRFFPLCSAIDELELIGDRLLDQLFRLNGQYCCNLEPHSGTQANQAVYNAVLNKGDTVVVMNSKCGGHASHYFFTKKYFNVYEYGVTSDDIIDYNQIENICKMHQPKLLIAGFTSYPRQVDYLTIGKICKKYNVILLADISHTAIYVINGNHISPFGHADFVTFTTHKTTRGICGGIVLAKNEYKSAIDKSIFPFTQGAPKFNEVLSKVIMLKELVNMDIPQYVQKIYEITDAFVDSFRDNNIEMYTNGSDSHLITLNLSKSNLTGKSCEDMLKEQYILVNRNSIPQDRYSPTLTSGIRIGTLSLATLNMSKKDYELILSIIVDTIKHEKVINRELVQKVMNKYRIVT